MLISECCDATVTVKFLFSSYVFCCETCGHKTSVNAEHLNADPDESGPIKVFEKEPE